VTSWQRLGSEADVQIGALRVTLVAEMLVPVEIRFVAVVDTARVACLRLTTIMKSTSVAGAQLPPGTTLDVFAVAGFRGTGIARLLWPWASLVTAAEQIGFSPLHSPSRTSWGQAYAEGVGGDIPPLAQGRYVECPTQVDPANGLWRDRQHLDLDALRLPQDDRLPREPRLCGNARSGGGAG
jgi:hypothetical protein